MTYIMDVNTQQFLSELLMIPTSARNKDSNDSLSTAERSGYEAVPFFHVTHVPVKSFRCSFPPHHFNDLVFVMTYLFHRMLLTFKIFIGIKHLLIIFFSQRMLV